LSNKIGQDVSRVLGSIRLHWLQETRRDEKPPRHEGGNMMQTMQRNKKTKASQHREKKAVAFLKELFTRAGGPEVNVRDRLLAFGNTYRSGALN
jgi:hypothetical protein